MFQNGVPVIKWPSIVEDDIKKEATKVASDLEHFFFSFWKKIFNNNNNNKKILITILFFYMSIYFESDSILIG